MQPARMGKTPSYSRNGGVTMKPYMKRPVLLSAILLLMVGLWIAYVRGDIGMSERAMCLENGDSMEPGDSFKSQIGESVAVFLHYNVEEDDYDLDIYVKRKNNVGWFFRFGGASGALDYLVQMNCEGNDEYVLTYLSAVPLGHAPAVSRIEVDKGGGESMTITPEAGAPFAYVMDHRWNVVVYGVDGSIIEPVERNM